MNAGRCGMEFVGVLRCRLDDINLATVLRCGQAFRWIYDEQQRRWTGSVRDCLWCLQQRQELHNQEQHHQEHLPDEHHQEHLQDEHHQEHLQDEHHQEHLQDEHHQEHLQDEHHLEQQDRTACDLGISSTRLLDGVVGRANNHVSTDDGDKDGEQLMSRKGRSITPNHALFDGDDGRDSKTSDAGDILCWARGPVHEARLCIIEDYLHLGACHLPSLYSEWARGEDVMRRATQLHRGVRVLRQDPVETLFAFICSSNNNIARITTLLHRLCERYGPPLGRHEQQDWFGFPEPDVLAGDGVAAELSRLGFGYRAAFVSRAAGQLCELGGRAWLQALRSSDYEHSQRSLRQLHGVGAKVADCVCLMALDKHDVVPVDTHVLQLVRRHYCDAAQQRQGNGQSSSKKASSMTEARYRHTAGILREKYGLMAGWAQAVLFCADLPQMALESTKRGRDNAITNKSVKSAKKRGAAASGAKTEVGSTQRSRGKEKTERASRSRCNVIATNSSKQDRRK